jgi:hypothetical protein
LHRLRGAVIGWLQERRERTRLSFSGRAL